MRLLSFSEEAKQGAEGTWSSLAGGYLAPLREDHVHGLCALRDDRPKLLAVDGLCRRLARVPGKTRPVGLDSIPLDARSYFWDLGGARRPGTE
jgi:hypothetical protein